ncbi:MAG: TlpA disulfide reductase family protein [Thermoanaerobaculia bacterium]
MHKRPSSILPLVAMIGGLLVLASTPRYPAAAEELGELLSGYGVRPVVPPTPAVDFTLPMVPGGMQSLSDYEGNWVLLTFLASWCGPCRAELPSLERLYRERSDAPLTVVGVSIDRDRAALDSFIDELEITFPMFWDESGQVGADYRASSIPLTYILDPGGRVVGFSRGARDWGRMEPLLDTLLAETAGGPAEAAVYAAGPVQLPLALDPPTAEISVSDPTPTVGETFYLDVRLHWSGDLEEYLPQPPRVQTPDAVTRERVTASTTSREGRNVVSYRLELRADEVGRFALDPVELRYTPRFESSPIESRVSGPTVEVVPRTIAGLRPKTLAIGGLTALAAGLAVFGVLTRWRAAGSQTAGVSPYERMQTSFEEARALRLQGDGAGFLLALAELEHELGPVDEESESYWRQAAERVRYGGQLPPADELDRLQRRVERRLNELRPDPQVAALDAVKLRREQNS